MRKFIAAMIVVGAMTGIAAADVADRKTCDEISAQISEMAGRADDLSDGEKEQLASLRTQHRRDCTKRAAGRGARTIANARTPVKDAVKVKDVDTTDATSGNGCASPDANGCCPGETLTDMGDGAMYCCETDGEMCFPATVATTTAATVESETPAPQKTEAEIAAEIAANIEKGLCGDGTKPNKYGCCGDEVFKDLGNLEFGCCPADGGKCYPPIGK